MHVRVAVPIAVFSVSYEVRSGRPYSGFERLVLQAVVHGTTQLEDLEGTFAVHRRVLVEAIVTLVQAGWIALGGGEGELVPTPAGRAALAPDQTPSTLNIRRPPLARILMEQVHGQLASASSASYRVLAPDARSEVIVLDRLVNRATLDPGEVQYLLPHGSGEWVSWIDPDVALTSSGLHYVLAEIDTERGVVHNLPTPFVDSLEPVLADRLGHDIVLRRQEASDVMRELQLETRSSWYTHVATDAITVGAPDHVALLERVLDSASTRVLIASAFLGERALGRVAPKISGALLRGVDVDLLWGYEGDAATAQLLLDRITTAAETARNLRGQGTLTVNDRPAGSHMKVLVWDENDRWHTAIGSFNWLSAHREVTEVDISVRLSCDGLTASVLRHVADVWHAIGPAAADTKVPRIWRTLAASLQATQVNRPGDADTHRVSLVFGRSHEMELRNALRNATHRILVTSHRLGNVGIARLSAGENRDRSTTFRGIVMIDQLLDGLTLDEARTAVQATGCQLRRRDVHAKVLIRDDTVLVGSYNYLSADVAGTGSRAKELSVRIEDPSLPTEIIRRL